MHILNINGYRRFTIDASDFEGDFGSPAGDGYFCLPVESKVGRFDVFPDENLGVGISYSPDNVGLVFQALYFTMDPNYPAWTGRLLAPPAPHLLWDPLSGGSIGFRAYLQPIHFLIAYVNRATDDSGGLIIETR